MSPEPRNSWVVWEEGGHYPDLIIELLSPSTAKVDREDKKSLYQNIFRTPEYFWFSPDNGEFAGFYLQKYSYQSITANAQGRLYSDVLGLYLGVAEGRLRYFAEDGTMLPTPAEAAALEIRRAESEAQRAKMAVQRADSEAQRAESEAERAKMAVRRADSEARRADSEAQRAEALAAKLRALGIDPDA